MEITYQVVPEDFVAFNLSYINTSPVMRKNVRNTRLVSAALILIGGCILMDLLGLLNAAIAAAYAVLALAVYFLTPRLMTRRVRKGVLRMLSQPQNQNICSEKTLTVGEKQLTLTGGGEDSRYEYSVVERVTEDSEHYLFMSAPWRQLLYRFVRLRLAKRKLHSIICSVNEFGRAAEKCRHRDKKFVKSAGCTIDKQLLLVYHRIQ